MTEAEELANLRRFYAEVAALNNGMDYAQRINLSEIARRLLSDDPLHPKDARLNAQWHACLDVFKATLAELLALVPYGEEGPTPLEEDCIEPAAPPPHLPFLTGLEGLG